MEDLWNIFPVSARKFDWQFDKAGTTIINLHKAYSGNAENLVVEMILGEIVGKRMCDSEKKQPHLVVIMDECQRLNWNESSFASQLMKESRKFGISVWAGTQVLGANIMTNALGQCGLMISFKPSGNNTAKIAKEMAGSPKSLKTKCEDRLTSLDKYQFLYIKNGDIIVASAP